MTNWKKTFLFKGKELYYNRIPYNNPSERAVEVSIGFNFLINLPNSNRVLEVGNVLSRYESSLGEKMGVIKRRIIDKFERDIGVDNEDLMTLESEEKYDAIVSISTVEHIGQGLDPCGAYGESTEIGDREAPLKAIAKIYDLLAIEGKAVITVPFGVLTDGGWYIQFSAQYLALLKKYGIPQEAIRTSFLRLTDRDPTKDSVKMLWEEREEIELSNVEYNHPFPFANAIAVIELCKVSNDFHLDLNIDPTPLFYNRPYENRVELDQDKAQLHPTHTDLEQYNQPEYQTQAKVEIISVHVPKTAGTTFYQVLSHVYGREAVFRDNENVPESQIKPSALPANIKVIHGHFALDKYKGYFHNAKKVIWLRNPVIRLISNYFFWRMEKVGIPRNMDVLGIVEFANLPAVRNIVANYIGKNQLSNFYFVGIQEFFQSDLEDLKTMMGWSDVSVFFTNANTFPEYDIQLRKILDDNEIVKKLAQSNSLDMELYQQALNLRAKRRNELGGFHQLLQLSEQSQSQLHQEQSQLAQSQLQLHQIQGELEQSQSQLHHAQSQLAQSQLQLHQTQGELAQSQSQLHQTQGELEQSQSQLHQTQGELAQSQSQHHQTQTELAQSQSQHHQTQAVLVNSQLDLHQTQAELAQSQSQHHQTQAELELSQSQLHQTQAELEQSQSQLHQTQEELEQSQSQLHQTQEELEQSQSQLHQTQEELEQSQSQLHQTQEELEQSQSQLHQTQEELEQSQSQLHQTQAELELSQSQLHQTQEELEQAQSQLHQTQAELEQFQSQLHQTQEELEQSQSQLHQTQVERQLFQSQLHQAQVEGQLFQSQLHQAQAELEQSQSQLHQTQAELQQSQSQLHQTQAELQQSQSQLHQTQAEGERLQFQGGRVGDSDLRLQLDYKLLVWEAWHAHHNGDMKAMAHFLKESLKCTPFSATETVLKWLESFAQFSSEKGYHLDTNSLINSAEWKELMRRGLHNGKSVIPMH
ncbi:hypothetical protein QUA20_14475 [Microcoleus sp. Pol7_A1]|uniref:hypothetical protein n=1 Tax=Microcoleus sp. Pol7_A1 TaxID=2818893 RepID=UPI002FD2D435